MGGSFEPFFLALRIRWNWTLPDAAAIAFFFLSFADGDGLAFLRVFGRTGETRRAIVFVFGFGWAHTFLSGLYVISPRTTDDEVFLVACGSTVI